ncbi:hypothetical protein Zm00014a_014447 [Zea mays]|uniref:Uncharacterized protein n=1 Tax=Zea mays TaxID=4577 RepID=A0A3L6DJN8_MAIZE|nr:hypothetical protein Zm00014a_014447 [Zea mays]
MPLPDVTNKKSRATPIAFSLLPAHSRHQSSFLYAQSAPSCESSLARSPMPRTAKLACAPHLPLDPLQAPCAGRVPLLGHSRAPALFSARALPFFLRAARPNAELGPALCSSSQSLRCRVPGRICVVVSFRGNAHFVVVLCFLLDPAWVLVVGQVRPCFLCLVVAVRSPHLDAGPYVLSLTCVRADKSILGRCGEAIPWSMPPSARRKA